jgi:tRNA(fMet)-specific endonuclease VapC
MRVLLDTNAYSALIYGRSEVADHVREAEEVLLSTVVLGEVLYGFRNGSRYQENRKRLDEFLENPHVQVVTLTPVTSERFGLISADLRRKGKPIPTNDIWIAAQTMETQSGLISSDPHFGSIEGLSWVSFPPVKI